MDCITSITPRRNSITTSSSCRSGRWPALPSIGAARRVDRALAAARAGDRMSLWAKYFVVVLAVPLALFLLLDRDARKTLATPGPYVARGGRARHDGAASRLAGAERFPALRLCRASRVAVARADRPRLASVAVCGRSGVLPDPVAADRAAAVYPAAREPPAACATHSTAASSPGWRSGRWRRCWRCPPSAVAAPWRCGAIRSGCSSACGWCSSRAARSTTIRLTRVVVTWAVVFGCLAARFHRQLRGAAKLRSPLSRGFLSRRRARPRNVAALSRRDRPADRLCDRQHVGRRQCRPLCARTPARADRRQAGAGAVDRPRRSASEGGGRGMDGRRSERRAAGSYRRSPSTPRCSRRSRCTTAAAMRRSKSAGRSSSRGRPTPAGA